MNDEVAGSNEVEAADNAAEDDRLRGETRPEGTPALRQLGWMMMTSGSMRLTWQGPQKHGRHSGANIGGH